jgi:hypothetical protein
MSLFGAIKDACTPREGAPRAQSRRAAKGRRSLAPVALAAVVLTLALGLAALPSLAAAVAPLVPTYHGTVDNLTVNESAAFTLTAVKEDEHGNISGQSIVDPPLYGGGPFTGTVSGTSVKFTSKSEGDSLCPAGACVVVFTGTVGEAGAMSGTYVASYTEGSSQTSQNGTWQLNPSTTVETTAEATAEAKGETPASSPTSPTVQIRSTTELFGPSGAVQAPAPKACISDRSFVIHIREVGGLRYRKVTVSLDGHRVRVHMGRTITATINLRGLPLGAHVVRITLWTNKGTKITGTRVYHTCTPVPSSTH